MTKKEVCTLLRELQRVFDVVRLVDAVQTTEYRLGEGETLVPGDHYCYSVWGRGERCEDCISAKALTRKARITKCEFRDSAVYFVVADYLEVDGKPYVLEIVTQLTEDTLLGALGKENLKQTVQQYTHKFYTDALTGAYNREYYEEQLWALTHASALAMVDVDNFKQVNDTYGHEAGDRALREVVTAFKTHMRREDAVIRYGGDEILLVFHQLTRTELAEKLEQLRRQVEQIRLTEYPELRLTVSIGGSSINDDSENRVRLADRRLYRAKETRNTVCCE